MLHGMWTLEWEGGCKDRMSEPCKPARHICFLSVHSSLLALNAYFIRFKCSWGWTFAPKIKVMSFWKAYLDIYQENREEGVKEKQWRVKSEKAWCRDTQKQKENMTGIQLWRKRRWNQKAIVENNREVYNSYNIFLLWILEWMLSSVFLYCHKTLWNASARCNSHSREESVGIMCLCKCSSVQTSADGCMLSMVLCEARFNAGALKPKDILPIG